LARAKDSDVGLTGFAMRAAAAGMGAAGAGTAAGSWNEERNRNNVQQKGFTIRASSIARKSYAFSKQMGSVIFLCAFTRLIAGGRSSAVTPASCPKNPIFRKKH
jgi:hypothetical protein